MGDTTEELKNAMEAVASSGKVNFGASASRSKTSLKAKYPQVGGDIQDLAETGDEDMSGATSTVAAFVTNLNLVAEYKGDEWKLKAAYEAMFDQTYKFAIKSLNQLIRLKKMSQLYESDSKEGDRTANGLAHFKLQALQSQFKTTSIARLAMYMALAKSKIDEDDRNKAFVKDFATWK